VSTDQTLTMPDGRTVGFADFGPDGARPLVWCHGGPGSRLQPKPAAAALADAGYRAIGIDRPGYGLSDVQVGRTIGGWVGDALAVLDHLGLDRATFVGVSTGGAYALATAASHPARVDGVVACCALTDMRWAEGRAMMPALGTRTLWEAPSREAALAAAADVFGSDGSKLASGETAGAEGAAPLPPSDLALFTDADYLMTMVETLPAMFTHGIEGYTDDRLADGPGWGTFDVGAVRCPVVVLHGELDSMVPLAHAHHTAAIVPGARLEIVPDLGHLSVIREIPRALALPTA
jgi:pimeloyl-ACP methyl ester carboxylesterase